MKASHRKDVIIARIIFAIICAALLAGIISLIVWLHGRNAGKNQTPETEITNNAPPADNSNLPPVTEQPLDEDGQSVWTSTDGVNFRAEPNTDSEILTVLVTGTKLTLLGEENGWVQAEYNGQKGYVSSDNLLLSAAKATGKNVLCYRSGTGYNNAGNRVTERGNNEYSRKNYVLPTGWK